MVLGSDKIFELIRDKNLIENLPEEGFIIEGATVDFRLDTVHLHDGGGELFENSRNTGQVLGVKPKENNIYHLHPATPYLLTTIEKVNVPDNIIMLIDTRTTMFRSGLLLKATYTNPGYNGVLTFMAFNFTGTTIPIQHKFRIAQAAFMEINGSVTPYCGQWQNGKIHTENKFVAPR